MECLKHTAGCQQEMALILHCKWEKQKRLIRGQQLFKTIMVGIWAAVPGRGQRWVGWLWWNGSPGFPGGDLFHPNSLSKSSRAGRELNWGAIGLHSLPLPCDYRNIPWAPGLKKIDTPFPSIIPSPILVWPQASQASARHLTGFMILLGTEILAQCEGSQADW